MATHCRPEDKVSCVHGIHCRVLTRDWPSQKWVNNYMAAKWEVNFTERDCRQSDENNKNNGKHKVPCNILTCSISFIAHKNLIIRSFSQKKKLRLESINNLPGFTHGDRAGSWTHVLYTVVGPRISLKVLAVRLEKVQEMILVHLQCFMYLEVKNKKATDTSMVGLNSGLSSPVLVSAYISYMFFYMKKIRSVSKMCCSSFTKTHDIQTRKGYRCSVAWLSYLNSETSQRKSANSMAWRCARLCFQIRHLMGCVSWMWTKIFQGICLQEKDFELIPTKIFNGFRALEG